MSFIEPHGMKTYDRHPDDVDIDLANEEFYERLERMIRAGKGGQAPCWLSADLAIVLYRSVREEEGWYKPRSITTQAKLEALPEWSVVLVDEVAWQRNDADRWFEASGTEHWLTSRELLFEYATSKFTVIYTPKEATA